MTTEDDSNTKLNAEDRRNLAAIRTMHGYMPEGTSLRSVVVEFEQDVGRMSAALFEHLTGEPDRSCLTAIEDLWHGLDGHATLNDAVKGYEGQTGETVSPLLFEYLSGARREQAAEIRSLKADGSWLEAIAAYESSGDGEIGDGLFEFLTGDDRLYLLEMEARGLIPASPEEIGRWEASLSASDARDLQDYREVGGLACEPEAVEAEVIGRFTRMVGRDAAGIDGIVREALRHAEPYESMVGRIATETGCVPPADRGAVSHYNATIAQTNGWDR